MASPAEDGSIGKPHDGGTDVGGDHEGVVGARVDTCDQVGVVNRSKQLLVFTEHRDTLNYLVENLQDDFEVAVIHGGLKLQERIAQERFFRERAQIMVATEAAGEGINLQFCHLMVNYDIPWNPNRLEHFAHGPDLVDQRHAGA